MTNQRKEIEREILKRLRELEQRQDQYVDLMLSSTDINLGKNGIGQILQTRLA